MNVHQTNQLMGTHHCTALSGQLPELLPTRGNHSALLIQSSLDTGAIQYLPCTISVILTCPRTLAGPLPPVVGSIIGTGSPFATNTEKVVCKTSMAGKFVWIENCR